METLKALGSFVLGIIKRAYYWVPPMFLDPFDLYKLYIRPKLPSGAPENIVMPSELAMWLFLALLGWAGFMTYRELHQKAAALSRQLNDRKQRHDLREALGKYLDEGHALLIKTRNQSEPPPEKEADEWAARTEAYLAQGLGESFVHRFRNGDGLPVTVTSLSSKPHRDLEGGLRVRLARLNEFLRELGMNELLIGQTFRVE